MLDIYTGANADLVEVVIHDDDETPVEFVAELLHTLFEKSVFEAMGLSVTGDDISCGIFPRARADALLADARQRIRAAGHPLKISIEAPEESSDTAIGHCKLCGVLSRAKRLSLKGEPALVCDDCIDELTDNWSEASREKQFDYACAALTWHFAGISMDRLVASSRQFPGHMRADVQRAINALFPAPIRFFGVHEQHRYETLNFAGLVREGRSAIPIAPAQYHDVDIGESDAVPCLDNGLWLCEGDGLRYAVVLSNHREYGRPSGTRIEIAVPAGVSGAELVQRCFAELQDAVSAARCYRGKVLSLDADDNYGGQTRGVMVHRLAPVRREEVILPEATVKLLDRNVLNFVGSREKLRHLGQSTRKGILLYGPPGTGKTHTIRYLASNLPGHTTLIITAAQIGLLDHYMALARLLQPAMVVIEDVDLIGRDRSEMGVCEEPLLSNLLNQMDGLKEDADILFVLTTNRPEQLESALAGRPGRVDQAIEVPLPDEIGRGKLVRLYGRGLPLGDAVVTEASKRTEGVSAAFIKELMRRIAQASIARDGGVSVVNDDISEALDDMLFTGGRLNVKLLGGAQSMAGG